MLRIAETPDGQARRSKPLARMLFFGGVFIIVGSFLFGVVTVNAIIFNFFKVQVDPEPLCVPL